MNGRSEHLPIYGPGPAYVTTIVALTAAAIALSALGVIPAVMKATEEKWLANLHGREYEDYCARTNRCIPWFPKR